MKNAAMTAGGSTWDLVFDETVGGPLTFLDAFLRNAFAPDPKAQETARRTAHMRSLERIRHGVGRALKDERRWRRLETALRGASPLDRRGTQTRERLEFLQAYVRRTPVLLAAVEVEASRRDLASSVLPILNAAEESFAVDEKDVLGPGGLLPALQDAFVTQRVLEEADRRLGKGRAGGFVDLDLSLENNYARVLLELVRVGATKGLECTIRERIGRPDFIRALGALKGSAMPSDETLLRVRERLPAEVVRG